MSHKVAAFLISFFLCNILLSQASAAKFYKWTDEDGNIHYADKAPDGVDGAEPVHGSPLCWSPV